MDVATRLAATAPRVWHVVDARNQVVGRLASQVAALIAGRHKPTYVPHVDGGDYVVVVNARHAAFTGDKDKDKLYRWHTGWMGGLKTLTAAQVAERAPERILEHAVKGMLPPNKLRSGRMTRLRIFPDAEHTHGAQAAASAAAAGGFLAAVAPRPCEPRPRGDTGALVKNVVAPVGGWVVEPAEGSLARLQAAVAAGRRECPGGGGGHS